MTSQPLISIVIPTYNRAYIIGETLQSVLNQSYTNWECIVIDDHSFDNTDAALATYIKQDKRFKYFKRPDTHLPGGNGARNFGFFKSKGDYIQWFDDDDIMLPNFLTEKVKLIGAGINLIFSSGYIVDDNLNKIKKFHLEIENNIFKDYIFWNFQVITNSVLFKREFLEKKELFKEWIVKGQETEFFSRLFFKLQNGFSVIDKPLFLYRRHDITKSEKNKTYNPEYRSSIIYTYINNLKRSVLIKDSQSATFCYYALINIFHQTFQNRDKYNRTQLTLGLSNVLVKNLILFDVVILIQLMTLLKINSYRLHSYLKKRKITI